MGVRQSYKSGRVTAPNTMRAKFFDTVHVALRPRMKLQPIMKWSHRCLRRSAGALDPAPYKLGVTEPRNYSTGAAKCRADYTKRQKAAPPNFALD